MVATAASAAPDDTPTRPGIGERIAEQALHHGARDRQRGADKGAEQQPRQPDVEQHELLARDGGSDPPQHRAEHARGSAVSVIPVEPIESDAIATITSATPAAGSTQRPRGLGSDANGATGAAGSMRQSTRFIPWSLESLGAAAPPGTCVGACSAFMRSAAAAGARGPNPIK